MNHVNQVKLDVVVPTYNRSRLLQRTLLSLLHAPIPSDLDLNIVIADNNSKDDTEQVVAEIAAQAERRISYIQVKRQGLSSARNGGIAAGDGDLIGFIDDDEEIHEDWFHVVAREFADPETQFIGGPYLGNWAAPAPPWLPPGYHAAIGVIPPKPRAPFGGDFQGMLMGGNAVLRRSVFDRVGLYSPKLGRSGKGLLSDEDAEFFGRLCDAHLRGMYVPDLIIYHHIPADRLTRAYHRRWCYWRGASQGIAARERKEPVPSILGVPRYKIGRALKGLVSLPRDLLLTREAGKAFADELATWDLIGFIYGRHFMRLDRYYNEE